MMNAKYICFNGEFRRAEEPFLLPGNRAFRYGDALCENIHVFATEAQFLEHHYSRLVSGMNLLYMEIPSHLTLVNLAHLITQLLNRNKLFGGGMIRLTIYRDEGVSVTPDNNRVNFTLESHPLSLDRYELNEKGLVIDLCLDYSASTSTLSGIKSTGSLLYVLTGLYCKRNHLDDAVLLNEMGWIAGSVRSNIFLVRGSSLFTPGLDQGCKPGVMRKVILKLATDAGFHVNDQSILSPAVLDDADEVFLTNAQEGIRWVGAFRQRRYYKRTSQNLVSILNELVFNMPGKTGQLNQFI
jgi:branched-subunit amino acid aminotransferase/4-amino-4-deoxychorismate lyase